MTYGLLQLQRHGPIMITESNEAEHEGAANMTKVTTVYILKNADGRASRFEPEHRFDALVPFLTEMPVGSRIDRHVTQGFRTETAMVMSKTVDGVVVHDEVA